MRCFSLGFLCSVLAFLPVFSQSITLEHAWTPEQISWGLMLRKTLPRNHGMMFHYPTPIPATFWSFNCWLDLSVAFIDENRVIREIQPLYAYPEKMDPLRPVYSAKDFSLYPKDDPIIHFFMQKAVRSKTPCHCVLEMNLDWFAENNIKVGDLIHWDVNTHSAYFTPKK